jgi:DNA-binding HxlR family transcriptional regulator
MFEERIKAAGVVLKHLRRGPKRYTELLKLTLGDGSTPGTFRSTVQWLLDQGYMERPQRGTYQITEKGRTLLSAISQ